jgi:hypothetical protein
VPWGAPGPHLAADVTLVQGKLADGLTREHYAGCGLLFCGSGLQGERSLTAQGKDDVACFQSDGLWIGFAVAVHGDKKKTGRELAEKVPSGFVTGTALCPRAR